MGDQAVTFSDLWNAAKDVATIMVNGESQHMPGRGFAVPSGHQPGELDWADETDGSVVHTMLWTSRMADWGLSTGTSLRLGASWKYGGRLQGAGRFLHDAQLWAVLDHSGLGQNFDIQASFGDPYLRGQTGVLPGTIQVQMKYARLHFADYRFDVEITGAGGGFVHAV
jgi:hypothetical protein